METPPKKYPFTADPLRNAELIASVLKAILSGPAAATFVRMNPLQPGQALDFHMLDAVNLAEDMAEELFKRGIIRTDGVWTLDSLKECPIEH